MINLIKENEFMVLRIELAYDICVIAMIWLDWKIYIR